MIPGIVNDNGMRLFVDAPGGVHHEGLVVLLDPRVMPERGPRIWSIGVKASMWPIHPHPKAMPLGEVEVVDDDLGSGDATDDRAHTSPDSLVGRSSGWHATRRASPFFSLLPQLLDPPLLFFKRSGDGNRDFPPQRLARHSTVIQSVIVNRGYAQGI